MSYDELLNHKSILDCENPKDEEQHGKDKMTMLSKIEAFGKHGAIVKVEPQDKAHKKYKSAYRVVRPEDYVNVVEGCDIKNGVDMVVHGGIFGMAAYGQNYTMGLINKETHMVESLCSFQFLKEKADFEKFEEMDPKEIAGEFERGENFLKQETLISDLRGVKRKELDALIQAAEERRSGNEGGKEKVADKKMEGMSL